VVSDSALTVPPPTELERDLQLLASELRRLEAEYNMYFGGRLPRPPHETRARIDALVKRLDRAAFEQVAQRFRFQTLQSRYATFAELWDRGLRSREEGRPRPGARPRQARLRPVDPAAPVARDRVLHDAELDDLRNQMDRVEALYAALSDARREAGESAIPFHRFAQLVRDQVTRFREEGAGEVSFRVAIKEGKIRLIARAKKIVGE
jgi:hypothetical protein